MPTIQSPPTPHGSGRGKFYIAALILALCVGAFGYYYSVRRAESARQQASAARAHAMSAREMVQRKKAYQEAMAASTTHALPTSPEEVITQFWQAASEKDVDTLVRLCPGSMKTDYASFSRYVPSPAKSIGKPETHPTAAGVMVYPVAVTYSGSNEKVYKMAVARTPDGHYTIDGKNTVWR